MQRRKPGLVCLLGSFVVLVLGWSPALVRAQTYSSGPAPQQELARAVQILGTGLSQDAALKSEDFDAVWGRLYEIYAQRDWPIQDPELSRKWARIEEADRGCLEVLASIAKIDNKKPSGLEIFLDSVGSDNSQAQKDELNKAILERALAEVGKYVLEDRFREKEAALEARVSDLETVEQPLAKFDATSVLSVEYLPSWNGVYAADLLKLTNNTGSDLANVPLLITITPREGPPIIHLHYVSRWKNRSTLMAAYPYEHSDYDNAQAIKGPAMVEASLYLPSGVAKTSYALTQKEWDSLVESYCKSLKFDASFLGPYLEDQTNVRQPPGMQFSFGGLSNLPVKTVTVKFWTSEQDGKTLHWNVDKKLEPGTPYDYRSGLFEQGQSALTPGTSPMHIQFALQFEGTNYEEVRDLY